MGALVSHLVVVIVLLLVILRSDHDRITSTIRIKSTRIIRWGSISQIIVLELRSLSRTSICENEKENDCENEKDLIARFGRECRQ